MSRQNSKSRRRSVWRAIAGLIAAWWRVDRVRVSPRAGELLRLRPHCLLTVDGVTAEVLRREEFHASGNCGVLYECQTAEGLARLEVRICDHTGQLAISWSTSGPSEVVSERQIEVFG